MYNQPENIIEKYEVEAEQISKGRGNYICNTKQGMKVLVPFRGSKERADFLRTFLADLKEQGYLAEQIMLTKEGEVLAEDDFGGRYLLKDLMPGSECSTKSREDMKNAAGSLAVFHNYSEKFQGRIPDFWINNARSLSQIYEKHMKEFITVKNYVRTRKQKNSFEQSFQKHYPYFMQNATGALKMLSESEPDQREYLFCHGDYNQHNVLRQKENYQIVHFEHLEYFVPMMDFSNYMRKMLEKNDWEVELGDQLINAYGKYRNLSKKELHQLYVMLWFPEKFWKLVNHYNNSRKSWLSERDVEKMDRMIEQEAQKQLFLENLFSFL